MVHDPRRNDHLRREVKEEEIVPQSCHSLSLDDGDLEFWMERNFVLSCCELL